MKKLKLLLMLPFLLIPSVNACSITNLPACIVEGFFDFLLGLLNAPIQVLLDGIQYLLAEPVVISVFHSFWALIIYIISMFYGLFLIYAGLNFMVSGYDAEKRERAKQMLQNIIIMVFLIQASYFIYSLLIDLSSLLTAGVINMINPEFFLLTSDNLANLGLELLLTAPYVGCLIISMIFLAGRYLIVSMGIIFFPIGIFFYFIPFLKSYGKLMMEYSLVMIFLPFFLSLILLFSSKLLTIPIFENFKIVLMICAFMSINMIFIIMGVFIVIKSAMAVINSDAGKLAVKVGKYLV
ncbi:hypothetical protein ACFL1H_02180 [Nanoarchaeota archaeon]